MSPAPAGAGAAARRLPVLAVVALLAGAAAALAAGDAPIALKLVLVCAPIVLARVAGAAEGLVAALTVAIGLETVSTLLGFYDRLAWWDVVPHTVLPALMTGVALAGAEKAAGRRLGPRPAAWIAFGLVVGLGLAWEGAEWTADRLLRSDFSLGPADTLLDLACDTVAAALGAAAIRRHRTRRPPAPAPAGPRARGVASAGTAAP